MPYKPYKPATRPADQSTMFSHFRALDQWIDPTIKANHTPGFHHAAMQVRIEQQDKFGKTYHGTVGNYCYFSDAEYYHYQAYSPLQEGIQVGEAYIDDEAFLCGLYVHPTFHRQGIGTELIRIINETNKHPQTGIPRFLVLTGLPQQHTRTYPDARYLTEAGAGLIYKCRDLGILRHDQLIGPTPDPSPMHYPSPEYLASPPHPGLMSPQYPGPGSPLWR